MPENFGCAIIVLDKNKVLLGRRKNGYKAGTYGMPGGRIAKQEKLLVGAKRELFEETGISANKLEYVGVVREWQDNHTFIHFIYLFKYEAQEVELREPEKCDSWNWFELADLPEGILPGHAGAIEMFKAGEKFLDL